MKTKYLWVLLPILTMWIGFYVVDTLVPRPVSEWWHFPVVATSFSIWLGSVILSINNIIDG